MNLGKAQTAISGALANQSGRPVIICIDGHSAAGKSTVAAALASEFDAAIVAGDHFYRVMSDSDRARLTPQEGADRYYDWQRMETEALCPLAAGRAASFRPYDWETGQLGDEVNEIQPASVVIVEGLFVSRRQLRHHYALTILVVTEASERRQRQLARADASHEWLKRWNDAELHHLNVVSPPQQFDVVISDAKELV